jgi:hypothetical protein
MDKNLKSKVLVIVATILICIYGIIGLPKSKAELEAQYRREHQTRTRPPWR